MTEIAPGMMVECLIESPRTNFKAGSKYFIQGFGREANCVCHNKLVRSLFIVGMPKPCDVLESYRNYPDFGWALCCFRPIGGDKEIEREESKRTGKSAKDNIKNNEYLDFIKLTPTRQRI